MTGNVKIFRLNVSDWWAGYDLNSVQLASQAELGQAESEAFVEEELSFDAMNTVRIYTDPFSKKSSTFQDELTRMVDEGHEFPCYFAGKYTSESASGL